MDHALSNVTPLPIEHCLLCQQRIRPHEITVCDESHVFHAVGCWPTMLMAKARAGHARRQDEFAGPHLRLVR